MVMLLLSSNCVQQQCEAFRQKKKVDVTANSMTICPPKEHKSTRRTRTRTPRIAQRYAKFMVDLACIITIIKFMLIPHAASYSGIHYNGFPLLPHIKHNKQTRYIKEAPTQSISDTRYQHIGSLPLAHWRQ